MVFRIVSAEALFAALLEGIRRPAAPPT